MWAERSLVAAAILAGLILGPRAASAQDEPEPEAEFLPPPVVSTGTAVYADGGRRDPFIPLIVELEPFAQGPRFESLRLTGVFLGTPGSSLVVLEDPAKRGYFVRVGEQVGGAVLVEIRPRSAVFEIRAYGAVRRQVLELQARPSTPVVPQPQQESP